MPASGIRLVDANVWLALAFSDHAHHERSMAWFATQRESTCAFCRITQLALLRHLTNKIIMGAFVQTQQGAWAAYDKFMSDPRVLFMVEPVGLEAEFRHHTQAESPPHQHWTDAYLAAFAKLAPAGVSTFDQGFRRFAGLDLELLG